MICDTCGAGYFGEGHKTRVDLGEGMVDVTVCPACANLADYDVPDGATDIRGARLSRDVKHAQSLMGSMMNLEWDD